MTVYACLIISLCFCLNLNLEANTNYDPHNSVNLNALKESFGNHGSAATADTSFFSSSSQQQFSNISLQSTPDYDPINGVNFNGLQSASFSDYTSSTKASTTLESFLSQQEHFNSSEEPITTFQNAQSLPSDRFNPSDGVDSTSVYNHFIPKQFSSQKPQPSLIAESVFTGDDPYDSESNNATMLDPNESVDVIQLKPFYQNKPSLDTDLE